MNQRILVATLVGGLLVLGLVAGSLFATAPPSEPAPPRPAAAPSAPEPTGPEKPNMVAPPEPLSTAAIDGGSKTQPPAPNPPTEPEGEPATEAPPTEPEEDDEVVLYPVDKEGIQDAMFEASGALQDCYDTLLESYPDVSGKMTLAFDITNEGDRAIVTGVDVVDLTVDSVYMEGCAVTAMEDLSFEPLSEGGSTTVRYPFRFHQGDD